eukprot:1343184-Pleurochrysis_carterae.AAC.1
MYVSSDAVKGAERESDEKTHQIAVQVAQVRPSVSPGWCTEARASGEIVLVRSRWAKMCVFLCVIRSEVRCNGDDCDGCARSMACDAKCPSDRAGS